MKISCLIQLPLCILFSCLFTNKMSLSGRVYGEFVTLIFFSCLLLFSWSGKCNVNQKSMCRKSGNFSFFIYIFLTWKWKHFVSKLCSSSRQMNKASFFFFFFLNTTFVYPLEHDRHYSCGFFLGWVGGGVIFHWKPLKFPWQWWLHKHSAVLAVNRLIWAHGTTILICSWMVT